MGADDLRPLDWPTFLGRVRCPTCGKSFQSLSNLASHLGRSPSHRTPEIDERIKTQKLENKRLREKRRRERNPNRNKEYLQKWRTEHPDYSREWRLAHADKERERIYRWRAEHPDLLRAQKARYYKSHRRITDPPPPIPALFQGHPFFETARLICGPEPYFDWKLAWQETMGDVVLAIVEGHDPRAAFFSSRRRHAAWSRRTAPIFENADIRDDTGEVVYIRRHKDA